VALLQYLIVVVPGIGGSVLAEPDGTSAWDLKSGHIGRAFVGPDRLSSGRELVPVRLVDDLVVLRPWLVVSGYGRLTQMVRRQVGAGLRVADYQAGGALPQDLDVLRVPYDFRRSVVEAADLLGRAVIAAVGDSGRRAVVVGHSLGGLVSRYWLGAGGGWRHCRALITLGTPHRGAPRALDWLVNGAGVGSVRVGSVSRVLREWPSLYELLPQYPAILDPGGKPVEVAALPPAAVREFGSGMAGADLLRRAAEAARVHRDMAAGWAAIPDGEQPALLPYFGRGHATPDRAVLRDGRLRVEKKAAEWRGNVGWLGDGTVPAISAIPTELSALPERAQAVPEKHGPMGVTSAVGEKLATLQGDDLPVRGTDRPPAPWVGWDVDDTVPAGQETAVAVSVHHGATGPVDVTGSGATLVLSGGPRPMSLPMVRTENGWHASVPALPEGTYDLAIEVKDAWHGTSLYASTPLAAVAPEGEASS